MTQTSPAVMGGHVPEVLCFGDNTDMVSDSLTLKSHPGCVTGALRVLRLAVKQRSPQGRFGNLQDPLLSSADTSLECFTLAIVLSCCPDPGVSPQL